MRTSRDEPPRTARDRKKGHLADIRLVWFCPRSKPTCSATRPFGSHRPHILTGGISTHHSPLILAKARRHRSVVLAPMTKRARNMAINAVTAPSAYRMCWIPSITLCGARVSDAALPVVDRMAPQANSRVSLTTANSHDSFFSSSDLSLPLLLLPT